MSQSSGCFSHRCPDYGTLPKSNDGYWIPKLARNVARDRRVDAALQVDGWTVVRVREHERVGDVVVRVAAAVGQLPEPSVSYER